MNGWSLLKTEQHSDLLRDAGTVTFRADLAGSSLTCGVGTCWFFSGHERAECEKISAFSPSQTGL